MGDGRPLEKQISDYAILAEKVDYRGTRLPGYTEGSGSVWDDDPRIVAARRSMEKAGFDPEKGYIR